ncbi:MAG: hypothetical protein LC115_06905 [Bacteroidia bacterium]|nr:hypothetical protein [Bacteroidia bacterium]
MLAENKYILTTAVTLTSVLLLLQLFLWGAQYELDTQFYLTGTLHWDIQHPPLFGFWVGLWRYIRPNIYAPIVSQIIIFSFSANLLASSLLKNNRAKLFCSFLLGIEPITAYFHLSLLPESLLASFFCFFCYNLLRNRWLISGFWVAGAVLLKLQSLWIIPGIFVLGFLHRQRSLVLQIIFPILGALLLLGIGNHIRFKGGVFSNFGGLLFPHTSVFYSDIYADSALQYLLKPHLPLSADVYQRYETYLAIHQAAQPDSNRFQPEQFMAVEQMIAKYNQNILTKKPLAVWKQIFTTNINELFSGNYLVYKQFSRFKKPITAKFDDLDNLMNNLYDYRITYEKMPNFWLRFPNEYIWLLLLSWVGLLATKNFLTKQIAIVAGSYFLVMMLTIFFYKTRFWMPIIPLLIIRVVVIGKKITDTFVSVILR